MKFKYYFELVDKINKDLNVFCNTFQENRKNLKGADRVGARNKIFNKDHANKNDGWSINYGGHFEIQYHISFGINIRYGLGFNTDGRPLKNITRIETVKPFMEAFLEIEKEIKNKLPDFDFIINRKDDLINPKEGNFVLFGKEIKIDQDEEGKSIDDKLYNSMLSDFKDNMFEAYKMIFEKRNELIKKQHEMEKYKTLLKSNKNIVLTVAPGTGKTYLAKQIAENMTGSEPDETNEQYAFIQFHPSYDYTDFVEGLRPIKKEEDKELGFELKNGIFKEFCKKAKDNTNKDFVFVIDEINRAEISKVFGELFFAIDPDYRGEKGKVKTQYSNMQTEETRFNDNDDYFYVPDNVYIIGTMNDIDRSVESFDFAMRRRFAWEEIKAEDRAVMLKEEIPDWSDEAQKRMIALNNAIEGIDGLNSSYHIGPAYFLKLNNYKNDENPWKKLWENHLRVLLSEYLRGMPDTDENLSKLKNAYDKK